MECPTFIIGFELIYKLFVEHAEKSLLAYFIVSKAFCIKFAQTLNVIKKGLKALI